MRIAFVDRIKRRRAERKEAFRIISLAEAELALKDKKAERRALQTMLSKSIIFFEAKEREMDRIISEVKAISAAIRNGTNGSGKVTIPGQVEIDESRDNVKTWPILYQGKLE